MHYTIDQFAKDLRNAFRKKKPYTLSNRDILHATEIAVEGIRHSEKRVRILSHKLDISLYGDPRLLDAVKEFLKKDGSSMEILVESSIVEGQFSEANQHPMISLARQQDDEKMRIWLVPEDLVEKYQFNFMTFDNFGYRLEANRKKFSATAGFHSEETEEFVRKLDGFFEYLKKRSKPISNTV